MPSQDRVTMIPGSHETSKSCPLVDIKYTKMKRKVKEEKKINKKEKIH